MNKNSIVYFYNNKSTNYDEIYNICTKLGLFMFECQKIDMLSYIMNNINPQYVIFDKGCISKNLIYDFAINNTKSIIYTLEDVSVPLKNVFYITNCSKLEKIICNHHKCQSNYDNDDIKDEKLYYNLIHKELDLLCFKSKYIGAKYLSELIFELLKDNSISNGKCSNKYPKLAIKYNTNTNSIERAMRFSISKAYILNNNKEMFFDISKADKIPTVKEVANYILDKIIMQLNSAT